MDHAVRWGILATGWIADTFTRDMLLAGLHVQAVGSRSQAAAQAFAARHGIATAHASYQALVADPEVDIVYIATPHPQHVDTTLLALQAGKHVLVEKPFTVNAADAQRIVDLAEATQRVVLEAMWTRFLPHMQRIREIIAAGTLGTLRSVTAEHRLRLPSDPLHRINALALGGGALLDLGIYPISFAFDMLGPPSSVSATARLGATGADAEVVAVMQHAGNALSISSAAIDCVGANGATVSGSEARIDIDGTWYAPTSFTVRDHDGHVLEHFRSEVNGRGMQFQALEMERLVRAGEASRLMPPRQSVQIMHTLDAIRRQIGVVYPGE